jgi:perosamine synthetase
MIWLHAPHFAGNEWHFVKECLETGWVSTAGPFVEAFESRICRTLGVEHGVATVNGTSALHIALRVMGVDPGDEVLVPSLSFVAPANAVSYCGAQPVFMDSEPDSWNLDPQKVVDFLERECVWHRNRLWNSRTRRRIAAVLPVHILGHPVDMDPILECARRYGVPLVEDAAESLGALYRGRPVGSLGDAACLSFNGSKIITTGGGGMVVTRSVHLAGRARHLATQARTDPLEYVHDEVGFNYRLPNLNAALGLGQLERLDEFIRKKREIAAAYRAALEAFPGITFMPEAPWATSTFWLNTILLDREATEAERTETVRALNGRGVQARPLWRPGHLLPMYRDAQAYKITIAPDLYRRAISLPSSVALGGVEIRRVIDALRAALPARVPS